MAAQISFQVAATVELAAVAEKILTQVLLPALLSPEPGGEWDDRGTGGSGPLQPARENAALAMVILAPSLFQPGRQKSASTREAVLAALRKLSADSEQYVAAYCVDALHRCTN